MELKLYLVGLLFLSACAGSQAQRCRAAAAFQRDPVVRELQLNRCEHIADRELAERIVKEDRRRALKQEKARAAEREALVAQQERLEREAREETEALVARREALERQAREQGDAAQHRAARASPEFPELGATPAESAVLCAKQGAEHGADVMDDGGMSYVCRLDGGLLYTARVLKGSEVFDAVRVSYEGADVASIRADMEKDFGPADDVTLLNGFRVWTWNQRDPIVKVAGGPRAVSIEIEVNRRQLPRVSQPGSTAVGTPREVVPVEKR